MGADVIRTVNPATASPIEEHARMAPAEVESALAGAAAAFDAWRTTPIEERAKGLLRVADALDARADALAARATAEMGKPISQARAEVAKCAAVCRHVAEHGPAHLQPVVADDDDTRYAAVHFEPIGVLLGIMPWNYPYWQVIRFASSALLAGNTIVVSHADNVAGCARELAVAFEEALPSGCYTNLVIDHPTTAEVIADPRVRGVALTGSDRAGREVASIAGRHLKKVVLELGGSDPFVVLADADVEAAADLAARARLQNCGQTCIASKRFIVHRDVYEPFVAALARSFRGFAPGDPTLEATQLGPMARRDLRDELARQVSTTIDRAGGVLVTGGEPVPGPGFFYEPTILRDVRLDAPVAEQETFGPVAAVLPASSDEAAIRIAGATRYGLGATIVTADSARGERLAHEIDAGVVFVNDLVRSDPRLPFGGTKDSGYGRELSWLGALEFVNAKTVCVTRQA